jgi:hypothetical protein
MVAPWYRHWWHYVDMDGRPTRRDVLRGLAAAGLLAWVPGCSSDGGQADRRSGVGNIVGRTPGLAEVVAGTGVRTVLPIGLADGDVVVVTYGLPDRRANISFAKTVSKGYTALFEPVEFAPDRVLAAFFKVVTNAANETAPSVSWLSSGRATAETQAYGGVNETTPIDAAAVVASSGNSTTLSVDEVITVTADARLLSGCAVDAGGGTLTKPPEMSQVAMSTGTGRRTGFAEEDRPITGATGRRTWTQSGTGLAIGAYLTALRSAVAAPEPTLMYAWIGAPTASSLTVSCRTLNATSVRIKSATNMGLTAGIRYSSPVTPDASGWAKCVLSGLAAGTDYYYAVEMTDRPGDVATSAVAGPAKTLPADNTAASYKVAFASCHTSGVPVTTAYDNMLANNPNLFLHLGDFHYADSSSTDQHVHRRNIEQQIADNAGLRAVLAKIPTLYIKSDHDSGGGDGALPGPWIPANRAAYMQVVPHAPLVNAGGLYWSMRIGRIKWIFTDHRYLRTAKSMMGAAQKAWFKKELLTDEPVKCWVQDSGWLKPFAPQNPALGNDKWSDYPYEHEELGDYIATSAVGQLFSIHGDTHMLAADDGTYNRWGFPTYCAAPLANTTTYEPGPWSEGYWPKKPSSECQHGLLDIADDGARITVTYTGYGTDGRKRVTHSISVPTV